MKQYTRQTHTYKTELFFITFISILSLFVFGTAHAQVPTTNTHGSVNLNSHTKANLPLQTSGGLAASGSIQAGATTGPAGANVRANGAAQGSAAAQTNSEQNRNTVNTRATNTIQLRGNATSAAMRNEHAASSTGQATAEAHRSTVANVVHSLLAVADHEGGIGAQIRTVARSQQAAASTTAEAMTKVSTRSQFMNFLFGSNYAALNAITKANASTTANIAHLQQLEAQTTNAADRATLSAQIQALVSEHAKTQAFVQTHQNQFSLFGWAVKLFVH